MENLVKVGSKTYYIKDRSKIGIYQINETDIYLIDAGFGNESGRKIYDILKKKNWNLKGIVTTHGHRDHTGGAAFLKEKYHCDIYATAVEGNIMAYPFLFRDIMYGGYSPDLLKSAHRASTPIADTVDLDTVKIEGLEFFRLPGHTYDMVGVRTSDDVFFLGDSLMDEHTLTYHYVTYLMDVEAQLNTLDYLEGLSGCYFVPSHTDPTHHLDRLVQLNRTAINDIIRVILDFCMTPRTFDFILQHIFEKFSLRMNDLQYVSISSTTRSYLAYLLNQKELETFVDNNLYYWKTV